MAEEMIEEKKNGLIIYKTNGGLITTKDNEEESQKIEALFLENFLKKDEELGIVICKGVLKNVEIVEEILLDLKNSLPQNVKYLFLSYHYKREPCNICGSSIFEKRRMLADEVRRLDKIDAENTSITLQIVACGLNEPAGYLHFASEQKWDIDRVNPDFPEEDIKVRETFKKFAPQEVRRLLELGLRFV